MGVFGYILAISKGCFGRDGYSKDRSSCIERFSSNADFPCDPVDCPPPGPERTPGSVEDPSNMWIDKRGNVHVLM